MTHQTVVAQGLVVPCYNEAFRLDVQQFERLIDHAPGLQLFVVDDGSTDNTRAVLGALQRARPGRVHLMVNGSNQGKAEAVRRGLSRALEAGCPIVGFLDADLAAPVDEVVRLLGQMRESDCDALLGSRVRLLGRQIERNEIRHYLGRAFATAVSLVLRLGVYDTQCGLKLFRRTPSLEAALAEPFMSRWVFDVELLSRLMRGPFALEAHRIHEEPLHSWCDISRSKLRPSHMLGAGVDLVRIAWRGHQRARGGGGPRKAMAPRS